MADWQFDLVRSVLDSSDWMAYVQDFTELHHRKWARRTRKQRSEGKYADARGGETKVGGYSHEQFLLFQEFSGYIDALLSSKLGELGVSEEDFFNTCQALTESPSNGPREALYKETLRQLLSYSSFGSFCEMMQSVYDEYNGNVAYSRPVVERRYAETQEDEDLALQRAIEESKREMQESKIRERAMRQQAARGRNFHPNTRSTSSRDVSAQPTGVPAEWDVQIATAQSILRAVDKKKFTAVEEEVFVPWAKKVIEVDEEYKALSEGAGMMAVVHTKIQELNLLRLKVDLLVAQQMTKENEKRRHDLNRKVEKWHEEMSTAPDGNQQSIIDQAEATLDDLLSRVARVHEEVRTGTHVVWQGQYIVHRNSDHISSVNVDIIYVSCT